MPLSEGDQGYSVANTTTGTSKSFHSPDVGNPPGKPSGKYATADGGIDPQFSDLGDIKPIHGNKGGAPSQPKVGYHRAD